MKELPNKKCEGCPLAKLLGTAIELNRQMCYQYKMRLYQKLLKLEKFNLN